MKIQEKLQAWAKETVKAYHEIAMNENLAYYTQSDLSKVSEEPDLMLIGINPGSGGDYTSQQANENWYYLHNNPLDPNHLLKGNYCKEKGKLSSWDIHRKWKYWNGLKKCLSNTYLKDIIDDDSKFIITNASFFNTANIKEIPEELLVKTIPYTLNLIKELNPRHLIFLSGKKCFKRLDRLSKTSDVIQFDYKLVCGNIYVGKLNKKLCIGIPHPTYKTREELDLVASVLPYLIDLDSFDSVDVELIKKTCATQINSFNERIHNNIKTSTKKGKFNIDHERIENEIVSKIDLISYEKKNNRYVLAGEIGITITTKDGGCIELRTTNYNNNNFHMPDEKLKAIRVKLGEMGYNINLKQWIGRKLFSQFGQSEDDIIKSILKEIEKLKEVCK